MTARPDDVPRIRRTTEDVYDALRARILENEIEPGERVNIDALARDLGVSQTPVREAVRQLEGDNLIVKVPGKGYRTTPLLDLERLRQLFEFRLLVDVWAVEVVTTNRLGNPARVIGQEIDRFELSIAGKTDIRRELVLHDTRFHGYILRALSNEVVREAYEQTHSHLHTFRLYAADIDGSITIAEHRRIWAAVESCDGSAAAAAMHEHLTAAFYRFAAAFDEAPGTLRGPATHRLY
ncbi:GntR family transcriptional regulator [Georgenia soli]|uniref:GntR family transcriptional regulator n=1 Tax=Georgenia soli TaxID=638953 RepID=UPI000BF80103|nr:GntR family transcriptional regulator [Georgenia soli]